MANVRQIAMYLFYDAELKKHEHPPELDEDEVITDGIRVEFVRTFLNQDNWMDAPRFPSAGMLKISTADGSVTLGILAHPQGAEWFRFDLYGVFSDERVFEASLIGFLFVADESELSDETILSLWEDGWAR